MGANAPVTPQAGTPPAAPVATNPVSANPPAATPPAAGTPAPAQPVQAPTPGQQPAAQPAKPATLQEVLAQRKLALNPEAWKAANPPQTPATPAPATPETPPASPAIPPETPAQLTPEQAMFQLYQQDPQRLMQILQAAAPQQTPPEQAQPANQPPDPQTFRQQQMVAAQQQYAERPSINLQGLLGEEVMAELGVANTDFTGTLEQFVYATIAPVLADLLGNIYAANHGFHTQLQQVQPVLQTHQQTALQRELGKQLQEAFPALATGDVNARAYAERRFNELAPVLMTKELMENPHTNPEEYARITTGIAKIAAGEYASLPPAPTAQAAPAMPITATVTPEPQPIAPTYRNHMGQFQSQQAPRTLEAWNQQRLAALSAKR